MNKIKLGFVGCGFNGQIGFIQNFYKNKSCKISGIAEARIKLLKKVSKKFKVKNQYTSHSDLIKNINKFDAIVIVAKRNMMPAIAYDFLKFKKPLLTEKPVASTFEQTKKLLRLARKMKTPYKIGYNKTYDQGIEKGKLIFDKLIKEKTFGNLIYIRSHRLSGSGYDPKNLYIRTNEKNFLKKPCWSSKPKWLPKKYIKSYSKYLNLYCHNINLLKFFTKKTPQIKFSNLSDKSISTVLLNYGKYYAILETGFFTKKGWDETFEIYFEKGHIKIILPPQHKQNISSKVFVYDNIKNKITHKYSFKSWSFKRQADDFVKDVRKKKVGKNNLSSSVEDMRTVEKIWKKFIFKS